VIEGFALGTGADADAADAALEPALFALHASVVAALEGRALPIGTGGDVLLTERDTTLETLPLDRATRALGRFVTTFTFDLYAPTGAPFATI
jgi:hypothetical protein